MTSAKRTIFQPGERVRVNNGESRWNPSMEGGRIVGGPFALILHDGLHYVVELDEGFWGEEGRCFVSVLVAHEESLEREEEVADE